MDRRRLPRRVGRVIFMKLNEEFRPVSSAANISPTSKSLLPFVR